MIYNTTLSNSSGTDATGRKLQAIGNQNLYAGKNVWTDGKVIYGYDVISSVKKRIFKPKEQDVIYYAPASIGIVAALIPKNYAKTEYEYQKKVFATIETNNKLIICGKELYEFYLSSGILYFKHGAVTQAAGAFPGGVERIDIGRNGGIVAVGTQGRFSYIPPAMNEYKLFDDITDLVKNFDHYWDWSETIGVNDINFENIADDGTLTIAVTVTGDHGEGLPKTYTITVNDNTKIENYKSPILGDGIGIFAFDGYRIQENGKIQYNDILFPATKRDKLVVLGNFVFVNKLNFFENTDDRIFFNTEIFMYDKTGTLLKKFGDKDYSKSEIKAVNNCRFAYCNMARTIKKWGYVVD